MLQYRYKIIIEYVGTNFVGWQFQANGISVQQILEDAIFALAKVRTIVTAAGRTDAGVHALGQVAHFDLAKYYEPRKLMQSLNHFTMQYAAAILKCEIVSFDFHARFSATMRHYVYKIINRDARLVIDMERAWLVKKALNIDAMRESSAYLIGNHDFTSYRARHCQASSPIRTLSQIDIVRNGDDQVHLYFAARSFLYHMVRNIVGSLVLVGISKWKPDDIKTVLDARSRRACGPTAPARGLYFLKVDY